MRKLTKIFIALWAIWSLSNFVFIDDIEHINPYIYVGWPLQTLVLFFIWFVIRELRKE